MFANAGVSGGFESIAEQSAEDWAEILRVNLIGPFLAIKYAAPLIKLRGGGSIVCTASVAGLRSGAGGAAYSASKAGVINLVQSAAQQLSGTGVRVNAICPGLIETGMTKPIYDMARDSGQAHRIGELNPLGRGGEPDEIARAALFLASDESSYVEWLGAGGGRRPVEQPPDRPALRHPDALGGTSSANLSEVDIAARDHADDWPLARLRRSARQPAPARPRLRRSSAIFSAIRRIASRV